MEISHEYAQSIVDKTTKIFDYNINIMNSIGIIVGSGDKNRVNTYHEGAAEVIKTGQPMEITTMEAKSLEGARPGVNLPIYLNDEVVGVVGITGEPAEVKPFGELLRISVETMLTQTFLTEQLRMEQNAKEFFIDDIISGDLDKDLNMFVSRGKILGFDMTLNRIAIVIKLYDMEGNHLKKNKKLLLSQQRRELVLRKLQNSFTNPQNMMSYKGSDNFVMFYVIDSLEYEDFKAQILRDVESFEKAFKKSSLKYRIGVGCFYPEITGLRKSYKEAVKTITLCDMIYRDAPDRNVVFAYDLALETMLASLPDHIYHAYSYKIMAKSSNKDLLSQDKLIRTLNAFFDNNLNSTLAAESLDITRNTMNNRLNTIKNITYLDPKNFNDAIKLKVLIALNEIKEFFNQS